MVGEPIRGEYSSADASGGEEIVLYKPGSLTAHTLTSDELIEVLEVHVAIGAGAGDVHIFSGADDTAGAGETLVRGTLAANGQMNRTFPSSDPWVSGRVGAKLYVVAPAGQIDIQIVGRLRKESNGAGVRPSWK